MRLLLLKKSYCRWLVICVNLWLTPLAHANAVDMYPLPTAAQQQQFQNLVSQLRCLVCQNQNLADSNADLAKDLRQQVYTLVAENKSDAQIKQYLTQRYGDFILFKPPLNPQTFILWGLPFLLLFIGVMIMWRLTRLRNLHK